MCVCLLSFKRKIKSSISYECIQIVYNSVFIVEYYEENISIIIVMIIVVVFFLPKKNINKYMFQTAYRPAKELVEHLKINPNK